MTRWTELSLAPLRLFLISLREIEEQEVERAWFCLDLDERERASALIYAQDRKRYVIAHSCVRQILSQILNGTNLVFEKSPCGKPYLKERPLHFNLSHAGDWALLGVHPSLPLGVDIEKIREPHLLESCLFPQEREYLKTKELDFLDLWCAKEAYVKALGIGLTQGFPSLRLISKAPLISLTASLNSFPHFIVKIFNHVLKGYKLAICIDQF